MNMYQKVTFTLPVNTVKLLQSFVSKGQKSNFAAKAIEEKLVRMKFQHKDNALKDFISLNKKTPKFSRKDLLEAKKWGRK